MPFGYSLRTTLRFHELTSSKYEGIFERNRANYKLPDPRMPGVVPELLGPFDLVGDNWFSDEALPVAIFWGFNLWKRPHMQAYFPGNKLAFVRGARTFFDLRKFIQRFPSHEGLTFVSWGGKLPAYVSRYAKRNNISVQFVEDGFLRSFHPGALHIKPWSLAIDSRAPYYDTSNPTDLQTLLAKAQDSGALARTDAGSAGIAIMRAARLTKYFPLNLGQENWQKPPTLGKKVVLVIGQVEDDAAILKGYSRKLHQASFSNLLVVKKAAMEHPDAFILYRPHPDTFHNGRKSRHEKKISSMCTIIEPTVPLQAVFPHVQHVYTGTSLAGLEAALWDIPVTTLGYPFYAATPNIRNLQGKAFAKLELPELFATLYIDYPCYIHPESDEATTFFDLASYFIVEKFKHMVLDGIPESVLDLDTLRRYAAYLAPPAKLLLYLLAIGRTGEENSEDMLELAGNPLRYEDIPQFSDLLIKACRFDTLALYLDKAVKQFTNDVEALKTRKFLMTRVMETLIDVEKVLRGRIDVFLPDVADWIAPRQFSGYLIPDALLVAYARALSNNLQYDILECVIANMEYFNEHAEVPYGASVMRAIAALLTEIPARSERNAGKRAQLLDRIGRLYYERLIAEPGTSPLVARATTSMAQDRIHEVQSACEEMLARIALEREQEKEEEQGSVQEGKQRPVLEAFGSQTPRILTLINMLSTNSRHDLVDRLLAELDENNPGVQVQRLRAFSFRQEFSAFNAFYERLSVSMKARDDVNILYMQAQMEEGEFLAALDTVNKNLALTTISRKKRSIFYERKEKLKLSLEASRILDSVPQPQTPKGVVFLGTINDYRAIAMLAPTLMEVRRKGYAVISLVNGTLHQTPTGLHYVDQFMGALNSVTITRKSTYHNEWLVNWSKKTVSVDDVNYYQGFYESLANFFRKYDIDLNDEAVRRNFFMRLVRADDCLNTCKMILRDVARQGLPSILLSGNGHVLPYSIFRDFCLAQNHPNLSFVNVNTGYDNYFTNLGGRYSFSMTASDMTLFPKHRAPFLARTDRFENWYAREKDNPVYRQRGDELINFNRVHQEGDEASRALTAYLAGERKKGRKVIACLGKIPIDLGVPYDGGPGHEDMRDWLNHTIKSVRGHEEILLLIKPHPHELQPSIALDLVDGFTDLIKVDLPDNVRILGHREINNHQLASHLDLALMWNGSSGLELTARGVPVMMAGYFGKHDYPVELLYPEDREHYRAFIQNGNWTIPDAETRRKAACLIAYMETPDVTIRNDYAWRPSTNDTVGVPAFRPERVEQLLREGDPEMERVAARILERFEGPLA